MVGNIDGVDDHACLWLPKSDLVDSASHAAVMLEENDVEGLRANEAIEVAPLAGRDANARALEFPRVTFCVFFTVVPALPLEFRRMEMHVVFTG